MTYSDVFYLCSYIAAIVGVGLLVGVFLGVIAAVGAAFIVLAGVLVLVARDVAATGGGET